jgi:hypothetical protein
MVAARVLMVHRNYVAHHAAMLLKLARNIQVRDVAVSRHLSPELGE